jgi:hypothetical protein
VVQLSTEPVELEIRDGRLHAIGHELPARTARGGDGWRQAALHCARLVG